MDAVTPTIMGIPSHTVPAHPPRSGNPALQVALPALPAASIQLLAPPTTTSQAIVDPTLLRTGNIGSAPSAPVSSGRGRQRTLAQPMGQNWARNREDALNDATASKSLKTQHQEIDDKKKCTCEVLIWFEVSSRPSYYYFPAY